MQSQLSGGALAPPAGLGFSGLESSVVLLVFNQQIPIDCFLVMGISLFSRFLCGTALTVVYLFAFSPLPSHVLRSVPGTRLPWGVSVAC